MAPRPLVAALLILATATDGSNDAENCAKLSAAYNTMLPSPVRELLSRLCARKPGPG